MTASQPGGIEVEDRLERRIRKPVDLLRWVLSWFGIGALAGAGVAASATTSGAQTDLVGASRRLVDRCGVGGRFGLEDADRPAGVGGKESPQLADLAADPAGAAGGISGCTLSGGVLVPRYPGRSRKTRNKATWRP